MKTRTKIYIMCVLVLALKKSLAFFQLDFLPCLLFSRKGHVIVHIHIKYYPFSFKLLKCFLGKFSLSLSF